jgi:hypothetical protein
LVTEPAVCGADGSLAFTSTNLPDGTYSLSFTGAGSPKDIVVSSNAFDLTGLQVLTANSASRMLVVQVLLLVAKRSLTRQRLH